MWIFSFSLSSPAEVDIYILLENKLEEERWLTFRQKLEETNINTHSVVKRFTNSSLISEFNSFCNLWVVTVMCNTSLG